LCVYLRNTGIGHNFVSYMHCLIFDRQNVAAIFPFLKHQVCELHIINYESYYERSFSVYFYYVWNDLAFMFCELRFGNFSLKKQYLKVIHYTLCMKLCDCRRRKKPFHENFRSCLGINN
jgi:hypothetical protein